AACCCWPRPWTTWRNRCARAGGSSVDELDLHPHSSPPGPASAEAAHRALVSLRAEVAKAVVGQDAAVTGLVIALVCRGHVLLEGVPGIAKTLLARAFCRALHLRTTRVQFTPDLMPGDVTG